MDRTNRTIDNLRQWVQDHPNEIDTLKEYVTEIADKLASQEYKLIDMSGVIKKWKRPHGQQLFLVFKEAYNKAVNDTPVE